ncbi:MAG: ATP synthase F1 subunit gamma [Planctomycetota bacterium]|nr:ATP synthase F1 subunit gamma [Planctomycetota bacterium]
MAKARAIVKRLKAVKNIRKITRTMELIATGRFKRAMDRANEAAAYTEKIAEIVADLARTDLDFSHPLLESRDECKNAVLLVLTSNRGLCGGYNAGVLRQAQRRHRELSAADTTVSLEVSGKRGIKFLQFQGQSISERYTHFEEKVTFGEVDELGSRFAESFVNGTLDRLDVAYMRFQSASRQFPVIDTILPMGQLAGNSDREAASSINVDYEFLPSASNILEDIVPAAFKAKLFKCFLDAAVSEQIFRMVAMKGATENANDMVGSLSQQYNRARQAQITGELAEIIGGVAALD